jgi:hypothetical protein
MPIKTDIDKKGAITSFGNNHYDSMAGAHSVLLGDETTPQTRCHLTPPWCSKLKSAADTLRVRSLCDTGRCVSSAGGQSHLICRKYVSLRKPAFAPELLENAPKPRENSSVGFKRC